LSILLYNLFWGSISTQFEWGSPLGRPPDVDIERLIRVVNDHAPRLSSHLHTALQRWLLQRLQRLRCVLPRRLRHLQDLNLHSAIVMHLYLLRRSGGGQLYRSRLRCTDIPPQGTSYRIRAARTVTSALSARRLRAVLPRCNPRGLFVPQ